MKLLLDTHTLLWHSADDPRMSSPAAALLIDSANELFLSMATLWEIAIKVGLGKLTLSSPYISSSLASGNQDMSDPDRVNVALDRV